MTHREYAARIACRERKTEILDCVFRFLSESKTWHGREYELADLEMDLQHIVDRVRLTNEQLLFLKQEQIRQEVEETWESA